MKVGIYYHTKKVSAAAGKAIAELLKARGAEVVFFRDEEEILKVDRLMVLGGDGSMLKAARSGCAQDLPIVGINYGTIGFLTQFERGEEAEAVNLVLDPCAAPVYRSMLQATVKGREYHCLNEIAFLRRVAPDAEDEVVRIRVKIDGEPAGEFVADGLILCTPTGSTAYSLSAGGSILTPDCAAFLLTPVNAFSLKSRPIVCSDASELSFAFPCGRVEAHGDGKFLAELSGGEEVVVKKSSKRAVFLAKGTQDFFRRLTEKIN